MMFLRSFTAAIFLCGCWSASGQEPAADPDPSSGPFFLRLLPKGESGAFQPLTQSQRFHGYLTSTFNYFPVFTAAVAGLASQSIDSPHEWGQGVQGWSKRFANNLARTAIRNTMTYGASAAIREDDRYFLSGKKGFWPRTAYALKSTVLARRPDGSRSFAYARMGAGFGTSTLSRIWAPPSWRGMKNASTDFSIWLSVEAGLNFGREFAPDMKRHFRR